MADSVISPGARRHLRASDAVRPRPAAGSRARARGIVGGWPRPVGFGTAGLPRALRARGTSGRTARGAQLPPSAITDPRNRPSSGPHRHRRRAARSPTPCSSTTRRASGSPRSARRPRRSRRASSTACARCWSVPRPRRRASTTWPTARRWRRTRSCSAAWPAPGSSPTRASATCSRSARRCAAHVYDLWTPEPEPVIPRERCLEVGGRLGAQGDVVAELDEAERAPGGGGGCARSGVEAVAVMLLFSFANPAHERARRRASWPRSCPACRWRSPAASRPSSASTCAPRRRPSTQRCCRCSGRYVGAARRRRRGRGRRGAAAPDAVQRRRGAAPSAPRELPIALAASGPAAGVIGAARLAARRRRARRADVRHGRHDGRHRARRRRRCRSCASPATRPGCPINLPQIDVLSHRRRRRLDRQRRRVRRAARRAGERGRRARAGGLRAGRRGRDRDRRARRPRHARRPHAASPAAWRSTATPALAAIQRAVAAPLGLDVEAAAAAVLRIANANMADALRRHVGRARARPARASRWSPSAGPGRCTPARWPTSSASRASSCRATRASPRRSACSPPTSGTTCAAAGSTPTAASTPERARRRGRRAGGRGRGGCWALGRRRRRLRARLRARHALPRPGLQPHGAARRRGRSRRRPLAAAERAFAAEHRAPLRLHAERHGDARS